jgi:hypothetical protein
MKDIFVDIFTTDYFPWSQTVIVGESVHEQTIFYDLTKYKNMEVCPIHIQAVLSLD